MSEPDSSQSTRPAALQQPNPEAESKWSCFQCRARKVKCDRAMPRCSRCVRLKDTCTFPESRQRSQAKRKYSDQVEDRIARLEQLLAESRENSEKQSNDVFEDALPLRGPTTSDNSSSIWNVENGGFTPGSSVAAFETPLDPSPHEVTRLGQFEKLPSMELVEELSLHYFREHNQNAPMLHQSRYMTSLHMPPHMRPPLCLQYIVMATAAASLKSHTHLTLPFYHRARRYAEADEMKAQGEYFTTVAHCQSWFIIAEFEAQQLMFSRASTSCSRGLRIAQMLGLHRLDSPRQPMISTLPPPKDWCELEERRRTWWVIFHYDRFISSFTGWPALINERDVWTLLPASDEAFEQGLEETTGTFSNALQGKCAYSSFSGRVLAAHVHQKTLNHTFQTFPDDGPEDVDNGHYWKRHREIDHELSNLVMCLPEDLRLPQNAHDRNAIFFAITVYSSTICVHRAALANIREYDLPNSMFLWSKMRLIPAADEIVNALKLVADIQSLLWDHFIAFSTYLSALVYLEDYMLAANQRSQANMDFLLSSLVTSAKHNLFTRPLALQLARGMTKFGVESMALHEASDLPPTSELVPILAKHNSKEAHVTFCSILPSRLDGLPQKHGGMNADLTEGTAPLDLGLAEDIERSISQSNRVVGEMYADASFQSLTGAWPLFN